MKLVIKQCLLDRKDRIFMNGGIFDNEHPRARQLEKQP